MTVGCLRYEKKAAPHFEPAATPTPPRGSPFVGTMGSNSKIYVARLLGEDIVDADSFQRRIDRLLAGGLGEGEFFWLDQCQRSAADKPTWSIELNLHNCHLLMSSAVDLDGRILLMREVGNLLFETLEAECPGQVDRELATFSATSAQSGLRLEAVVDFSRHVRIVDGELDVIATTEELALLAEPVRAPTICSRVSSTPKGIGQSAKRAREDGGHYQKKAAGELGSKRRKIADKSVFYKSEARDGAPYVAHTRLLPLGGIGFMAHTLRGVEKMGSKHDIQRVLPVAAPEAAVEAPEPVSLHALLEACEMSELWPTVVLDALVTGHAERLSRM